MSKKINVAKIKSHKTIYYSPYLNHIALRLKRRLLEDDNGLEALIHTARLRKIHGGLRIIDSAAD